MDGDRELDIWIAQALGWTVQHHTDSDYLGYWSIRRPNGMSTQPFYSEQEAWREAPHYTTTDCLLVAEAMRKRGFRVCIELRPDEDQTPGGRFVAACVPCGRCKEGDFWGFWVEGDTVGLAVCRAAKSALEAK